MHSLTVSCVRRSLTLLVVAVCPQFTRVCVHPIQRAFLVDASAAAASAAAAAGFGGDQGGAKADLLAVEIDSRTEEGFVSAAEWGAGGGLGETAISGPGALAPSGTTAAGTAGSGATLAAGGGGGGSAHVWSAASRSGSGSAGGVVVLRLQNLEYVRHDAANGLQVSLLTPNLKP